jgi:hypothetical protein
MRLARRNRVLKLPLRGIEANADLLYDGTFLRATTDWWNDLLTRDREFAEYKLIPFDQERTHLLISAVEPANRWTFKAVGDHVAMSCFTKSGGGVSVGLLVKGAARGTSFCFLC